MQAVRNLIRTSALTILLTFVTAAAASGEHMYPEAISPASIEIREEQVVADGGLHSDGVRQPEPSSFGVAGCRLLAMVAIVRRRMR